MEYVPYTILFFAWSFGAALSLNDELSDDGISWILSAIAAFILSVEGVFFALPAALQVSPLHTFVLQDSSRSCLTCDLFIGYCLVDLFLGAALYDMKILEGYVHHIFYIIMLSMFRILQVSNCFWIFAWCEIPTLLLALPRLGYYVPSYFFNMSFLLFRVALFTAVLVRFFWDLPVDYVYYTLPPALVVWSMHMWWGYKVCRKINLLL